MSAVSLQVTQNNLIREILGITDLNLLERLEQFLHKDRSGDVVAEEPFMTKSEVLSHVDQACKEYLLIKQGKMKAISKEELLNDL